MLYEILVRATELLTELEAAPVTGTVFKVAEDIPEMIQDFDGYIAFMSNPAHTQENTAPREFPNIVTFPGLLVGVQILTGIPFQNRTRLLQYADLIQQKFIERPQLNNSTMTGLAGVEWMVFQEGRVFEDAYPRSQNQIIRHQYSFSIQVKYKRYRTLSA
jgi:hypothetical protein